MLQEILYAFLLHLLECYGEIYNVMPLFWLILRYIQRKTHFCTKFKAILMTFFSCDSSGGQSLKTNRKIRRRVYSVPQETLEYGRRFFLHTEEILNMEKEFKCVGTLCDEMFGWIFKDSGGILLRQVCYATIIVVRIMSKGYIRQRRIQNGKRKVGVLEEFAGEIYGIKQKRSFVILL